METITPTTGDLIRTVKISGKVKPKESVDLGFEITGTVVGMSKEVGARVQRGDLIAQIDTRTIATEILKAEADLALAKANLDKLDGAGIYEAQIDNAKRTLIQTIIDTYTTSDDAVHNKIDHIYIDPRSSRPELVYAFGDHYDLRDSITRSRLTIDETLETWKSLISDLTTSNYTEAHLVQSKEKLSEISLYVSNVVQAINLFKPSQSLLQTSIDTYQDDALSARDNINSATQNLISAEDRLRGLLLEVPVQVARVESASATLLNSRSQLSKTSIISPINGIVTRQDAKVGQVISSATSPVTIISQALEIEAYIPEVLISEVEINNSASVTLDAYSNGETFKAQVIQIDPAETIRDGVSTYKVTLTFSNPDKRIRPGMTANIDIETYRKPNARLLLERAVLHDENGAYIYALKGNTKSEKINISIGTKDSTGQVELLTDLPDNMQILSNPTDH
jgi:RND family efflux transporter MFP subunit